MTLERYLEASEQTEEELLERLRPNAVQQVKVELVLEAIAKAEQLEPTEEEIDARLQQWFATVQDPKERDERLRDEDNRLAARNTLRRAKALDFLVEHAHVSVTEYEATDEQDGQQADAGATAADAGDETAPEAQEAAPAADGTAPEAETAPRAQTDDELEQESARPRE